VEMGGKPFLTKTALLKDEEQHASTH
jgi:hypothetical protein